ncbi:MAG TPA: hypothetical protein VMW63_05900 [Methanoregulaceae archaeon]|nr:hypothetical protein [Methanoregulaceae archaeon]
MSKTAKIIGVLTLIFCIVQIASANIAVGNIGISPSGDLVSGQTQVSVSFVIEFASSGGYTFDNENTLQMSTDLDSATWSYVIIQDGVENPAALEVGSNVNINGWVLSYPSNREISMRVNMNGMAPQVDTSEEKVVIGIAELSSRGSVISSSVVEKTALVLNPSQIDEVITSGKIELNSIRSSLDSLAAAGVDVSAAETKYSQAESNLQNAELSSDYARAQSYVSAAQTAINELTILLQQMQAQKAINDANVPVEQTDELITYFKVNKSMDADPRLAPIITKREIAAGLVVDARDLASEEKYNDAIQKAGEAYEKANEALNDAIALKENVDSNPLSGLGGMISGALVPIVIIIVVVVLAVAGFLFFRGRRRWDELG